MGIRDLTEFQTWPFETMGHPRALDPPADEEPPRTGEGGIDCPRCENPYDRVVWHDDRWLLTLFENSPFLGVVLLQPRDHLESIADLPPVLAAEFGPMVGRVQRAIERLGGIGGSTSATGATAGPTCTSGSTHVPTGNCSCAGRSSPSGASRCPTVRSRRPAKPAAASPPRWTRAGDRGGARHCTTPGPGPGGEAAALCGWSMGGLVAMLAAQRQRPGALVLLEPSQPQQLGRSDPSVTPTEGTYDAESMYGPLPAGTRHRPESLFALGERQRGVDVPRIGCPLLVVAGSSHPIARGRDVAAWYGGELLEFANLDHTSLVNDPAVATAIADWLTPTATDHRR